MFAMPYDWNTAQIGDAGPVFSAAVNDRQIAAYCRAARCENLLYTSQPAARESGLPGIVAPPAMLLAYAPARVAALIAGQTGDPGDAGRPEPTPARIAIRFQGALISQQDLIASQTRLVDKYERDGRRYLVFRVTVRNQREEPVAEYEAAYLWEPAGGEAPD